MFLQKRPALHVASRAFIGVVLLAALCCVMTPAVLAASHDSPPLIETICKDTSIPPGWVIVDILTDLHRCSGSIINRDSVWAITRATGPTGVCANSPIPAGFVVTAQAEDVHHCQPIDNPFDVMTITPITGQTTLSICASSPLPSGWVVTGEYRLIDRPQAATTCLIDAGTATGLATTANLNYLVQKTLQLPAHTAMQVCADSPLPKGYSLQQRTIYLASCALDQGSSLLIVPSSSTHWSV